MIFYYFYHYSGWDNAIEFKFMYSRHDNFSPGKKKKEKRKRKDTWAYGVVGW